MIEELKALLEALSQTPDMALYAFAFFIAWKLIVYLSTAGSIVYVCRLGITKLYEYQRYAKEQEKVPTPPEPDPPPLPQEPPREWNLEGRLLGDDTRQMLSDLLMKVARARNPHSISKYFHTSDAHALVELVENHIGELQR